MESCIDHIVASKDTIHLLAGVGQDRLTHWETHIGTHVALTWRPDAMLRPQFRSIKEIPAKDAEAARPMLWSECWMRATTADHLGAHSAGQTVKYHLGQHYCSEL